MKALYRAREFCHNYELEIPILMAPMAGACPTELAAAISNAGGIGSCGALLMTPEKIAAHDDSNPVPAPYPIQRSLTKEMREQATKSDDIDYMQAWAGQAAALAQAKTAQDLVTQIWVEAQELFG